jgi:hypothetical protein
VFGTWGHPPAASASLTLAVETEQAVVSAARATYAHARDLRSEFEAAIWRGVSAPNVIDDRGGGGTMIKVCRKCVIICICLFQGNSS